jgi:hypothetical protein
MNSIVRNVVRWIRVPLHQFSAYNRAMSGSARFRVVLPNPA